MSGHHPWSELVAEMSPERRARIKAESDKLHREYVLSEIRRQAGFTQCEMAENCQFLNRPMLPLSVAAICALAPCRKSLRLLAVS